MSLDLREKIEIELGKEVMSGGPDLSNKGKSLLMNILIVYQWI